jgi:probable H4MPT-linked C1 transfer pathway protein
MATIGLDIGGANLKAARPDGSARLRPFALWKDPERLPAELRACLGDWLPCDQLAVTMTGELCDCFADRAEGVRSILLAIQHLDDPSAIRVWRSDGRFATLAETLADPLPAASANWLALATWAGTLAPDGVAVVFDVGSTTTDIVPLVDGLPCPTGRTDFDRLRTGELVYSGVRRTPACALAETGEVMAELFATAFDVYLALGQLPEEPHNLATADGRPATQRFAMARLARMLGADASTLGEPMIREFAERIADRQRWLIRAAWDRVVARLPGPVATVIAAGSGEFLATAITRAAAPQAKVVSLSQSLGPATSAAACAFAVAVLAKQD